MSKSYMKYGFTCLHLQGVIWGVHMVDLIFNHATLIELIK